MNKVFSMRLDELVVDRIDRLAKALKISKKAIVESAVSEYADQMESRGATDVFEESFGAWRRNEKTEASVRKARHVFQASFDRRKR